MTASLTAVADSVVDHLRRQRDSAVPAGAAFDLDASTSGGGAGCDLPVTVTGKRSGCSRLKGPVNGGGKPVVLRSSGGDEGWETGVLDWRQRAQTFEQVAGISSVQNGSVSEQGT